MASIKVQPRNGRKLAGRIRRDARVSNDLDLGPRVAKSSDLHTDPWLYLLDHLQVPTASARETPACLDLLHYRNNLVPPYHRSVDMELNGGVELHLFFRVRARRRSISHEVLLSNQRAHGTRLFNHTFHAANHCADDVQVEHYNHADSEQQ